MRVFCDYHCLVCKEILLKRLEKGHKSRRDRRCVWTVEYRAYSRCARSVYSSLHTCVCVVYGRGLQSQLSCTLIFAASWAARAALSLPSQAAASDKNWEIIVERCSAAQFAVEWQFRYRRCRRFWRRAQEDTDWLKRRRFLRSFCHQLRLLSHLHLWCRIHSTILFHLKKTRQISSF